MENQSMIFPKTFEEFAKSYGFVDEEEVYTNGSELIPVFRVQQWLDHIKEQTDEEEMQPKGKWVDNHSRDFTRTMVCSICKNEAISNEWDYVLTKFCPNCGAEMEQADEQH
jgi:hypothetical protein